MPKYAVIFGTRPEYLKVKSIINEIKKRNINFIVIYVQQHIAIDKDIDIDIDYKYITISNDIYGDRLCCIGQEILLKLQNYINDCSHVIIQGDTATAFYSAIVAFQLQKKIIHVEAGLRTYDLGNPFPEEAYRQMISRISTIHFTPHDDSTNLLINEKVTGKIYNVGNSILDLIKSYNLVCTKSNIVLITFHRRENWNKIELLLNGLKKLIKKTPHIKYLWYLHYNLELQRKVKESINLIDSIELKEPCSHKEFTKQMAQSNFLISDSGGIQEEASFLGKHCIVLRTSTERSHIPKEYITILDDYSRLDEVYDILPDNLEPCNVYGNGDSCKKILNIMEDNYSF